MDHKLIFVFFFFFLKAECDAFFLRAGCEELAQRIETLTKESVSLRSEISRIRSDNEQLFSENTIMKVMQIGSERPSTIPLTFGDLCKTNMFLSTGKTWGTTCWQE